MARGRHAKRSGLMARLFPGRTARRLAEQRQQALLRQVAAELRHLSELADAHAAAAERAEQRAAAAEAAAAGMRLELARLREELLWAWAERRLPSAALLDGLEPQDATVIDLRDAR